MMSIFHYHKNFSCNYVAWKKIVIIRDENVDYQIFSAFISITCAFAAAENSEHENDVINTEVRKVTFLSEIRKLERTINCLNLAIRCNC